MPDSATSTGEVIVFPRSAGGFVGWLFVVVLVVVGGWTLAHTPTTATLAFAAGCGLLAVLVHAYLLRPVIRAHPGFLELVNPLSSQLVPWADIDDVAVRSVTYVYVGQRRYSCVAVGRTVRQMSLPEGFRQRGLFGSERPLGARDRDAAVVEERLLGLIRARAHVTGEPSRQWSWPHLVGAGALAVLALVAVLL